MFLKNVSSGRDVKSSRILCEQKEEEEKEGGRDGGRRKEGKEK